MAIDHKGRIRAWSRRGTSLGDRLGSLLEPLAESPRATVFDAELVALSSGDGRAVQDFTAVCRATLQADAAAAGKLHLVAFDLLETTWLKYKASHRASATLRALRPGRDGYAYAISELDGRRVTTLGSPRLGHLSR